MNLRILAIDYGAKRFGLAYGDELGLAIPLPALTSGDEAQKMQELQQLIRQRKINQLVVGLPTMLDGSEGVQAQKVHQFVKSLAEQTQLPVALIDERMTSRAAEGLLGRNLKQSRKERSKGVVDSVSASLFLQDYLDSHLPPPME
jgi:putative Holliday junction resolvase